MTLKDLRYKLQRLNMDLRNADLYQFQPKLRALGDLFDQNKTIKGLLDNLKDKPPSFNKWRKSLPGNHIPDLNFSEEERASLGLQAVNEFKGKDAHSIIDITTRLTGERHLNSHVRAFYDTFVNPLCSWLGEKLEKLEQLEADPQSPDQEAQQLITQGESLLENAKFDDIGHLLPEYKNKNTQWVSDSKQLIEEHLGVESELYNDFHRVEAGPVYPLTSDLKEEYRKKRIDRFRSNTGSRIAYLSSLKKTLRRKQTKSTTPSNIIPKKDIAKKLNFVRNKKLKSIITRDLYDAQSCKNSSHKSVITLCGGAIEGILIYQLSQGGRKTKAVKKFKAKYPKTKKANNINSWKFEQLINISKQVGLIDAGLKSNLDSIRNFRNFVHPYREIKSTSSPDEHLATIALESAMHLVGLGQKK